MLGQVPKNLSAEDHAGFDSEDRLGTRKVGERMFPSFSMSIPSALNFCLLLFFLIVFVFFLILVCRQIK
jgi:hypothetical protein